MRTVLAIAAFVATSLITCRQPVTAAEPVPPPVDHALPPSQQTGGRPFLDTVKDRHTTRELLARPLPDQLLANLLWAAFGINRPQTDHRTAPSAMNSQEIDLFVARADGLFTYEAKEYRLKRMLDQDIRSEITGQAFGTNSALVLVYVADLPRLKRAKPETRLFYAALDTGAILQNVYLFCASEKLGCVVFDLDRPPLARIMKLRPDQQIILAQSVGYPRE